jgi:predicted nucleic acid-binding protein
VTLVLDAGGVSALAGERARLRELRNRGLWPAQVPSVVLTETLTGDHRRDHAANRLLRTCQVREVDERLAREAARLRTATGRASQISAVDAVVMAYASDRLGSIVITSDPGDLRALAEHASSPVTVVAT